MNKKNIKANSEAHVTAITTENQILKLKELSESIDELDKKMYRQLVEIVKANGGIIKTDNKEEIWAYQNESDYGCGDYYTEKKVLAVKVEDDILYVLLGGKDEFLFDEEKLTQDEINEMLDNIQNDEDCWYDVDYDNFILTTPTLYWMCCAIGEYIK